jgi:hypothetical protein
MMKSQEVQALTALGQVHDSGLARLGHQPQIREQPNQMRERILGLPTGPAHDHHIVGLCGPADYADRGVMVLVDGGDRG